MKKLFGFFLASLVSLPLAALEVGDPAPEFSLQGSDGKTHKLSDYKGDKAVVIAWYPKAFTKGCTIECKSLAENGHLIREYDVAYFMASTDELETNKKFAEEQKADFPLLSDPEGEVAKAYDVLMPVMNVAKRITIYIGKDGRILKIDRDIKPATSAQDMARTLGELGVERKG
ncbi:peroxiredoxin [Microbulbifer flavimaris]|uniref:thioredoxin-dependent peroxiredoxin n=1 Tax=Microbulbifer flavimaris TaxID=1781068 RepID=A0ABX4HXH2_9GAMM|nr:MULTISPECIES: peroxiredoxin [Microbulbifer]KUJ81587.1 alkyl hydroperoxide reductase [Microbulbifer sp. ZGT114]PCO04493.1 peroxiredoxin [Microbulbifer flavimaris]